MNKTNTLTNLMVIDEATGEFKQYLTKKEKLYLENTYTSVSRINDNGFDNKPSEELFNLMVKEYCGSFYFSFYDNILNLENSYLFRFIYISTFSNYKGYLEFGNSKAEGKLIKKNNMEELLRLKRTESYNTVKYLEENNLISYDNDGYVKINTNISKRGKVQKDDMKKDYTRIFDNAIREIYENCSTKEHKTIGIMIKLLPYVHFKTNIICVNPKVESPKDIIPLKLIDILNLIEGSKASIRTLMNFKIMNSQESAFIKTSNAFTKNFYIINPRITYKGLSSYIDTNDNSFEMEKSLSYFTIGNSKKV